MNYTYQGKIVCDNHIETITFDEINKLNRNIPFSVFSSFFYHQIDIWQHITSDYIAINQREKAMKSFEVLCAYIYCFKK